jgi:hypothetical protein|tara:strand:- start:26270 stop:26533 length:264 start_codon:yes stop_codon:yes gene_type:complete
MDLRALSYRLVWREHRLHGWMENFLLLKGGRSEFNLAPVQLTLADLDHLETHDRLSVCRLLFMVLKQCRLRGGIRFRFTDISSDRSP